MNEFSAILNILLGGGLTAMLVAGVAAIRKYRAGEIVDDDAVIARLNRDNEDLRKQNATKDMLIEAERRGRWDAEERAERYRVRLIKYEDVGRDD